MSISPAAVQERLSRCVDCDEHDLRLEKIENRQDAFDQLLREVQLQMADLGAAVREQSAMMGKYLELIVERLPRRG